MPTGLILFAHGARNREWARPFEQVRDAVAERSPERQPVLAFLELMSPDLPDAIALQVQRGFRSIRIVPLFLGFGGHLQHDLPRLVESQRVRHPGVSIEVAPPVGEAPDIIEALARHCAS